MRPKLRALRLVAAREWSEAGRSPWLWGMLALLILLPLLLSALGMGVAGTLDLHGFARTSASLVNLGNYLLPLMGLQLAQASLTGEAERGTLGLLASQPIDRSLIVLGKFLGLATLLLAVVGGAFGLAGVLIAVRAGFTRLFDYAWLVGSAVVLGWVFVALGLLISAASRDRARALGASLAAWLLSSLLFDLALLALFVAASHVLLSGDYAPSVEILHRELTRGNTGDASPFPWLSALVLLNPADVFRLWNVLRIPELRAVLAMTRSLPPSLYSVWLLSAVSGAWIAGPLWLAMRRFERTDLR
ncbi:MAG: ABC transporter permease subunit [Myxococcales bacterium]